jgi:DNA-binding NarL/FixJ family response regulator
LQRRILIADDHSLMRSTLKAALESHPDWQVCAEAKDGLEAVQEAVELMPDIVILDFTMPALDGLRAARKILSAAPAVPILLYTNHASSTLVVEAAKAGVRLVVSKSAPVEELFSAVESVLSGELVTPINAVTASSDGTAAGTAGGSRLPMPPGAPLGALAALDPAIAEVPLDANVAPDGGAASASGGAPPSSGAETATPPSAASDPSRSSATGAADRPSAPPDAPGPPDAVRKHRARRRPRAAAASGGLK